MTLKSELTALAAAIRKRAGEASTPFTEAVDALKALTALYATFLKDKGKSEDEPDDGFTMADAQTMIEDNGHGEAAVRSHRRRNIRPSADN
jgi:hypothetical protein